MHVAGCTFTTPFVARSISCLFFITVWALHLLERPHVALILPVQLTTRTAIMFPHAAHVVFVCRLVLIGIILVEGGAGASIFSMDLFRDPAQNLAHDVGNEPPTDALAHCFAGVAATLDVECSRLGGERLSRVSLQLYNCVASSEGIDSTNVLLRN